MIDGTYYPTIVPQGYVEDWIPYERRDADGKYLTDEFHEQIGEWGDLGLSFGALPKRVLKEQDEMDVCGEKLLRIYQTTGSCLPATAQVRMADGTEKPICEVKAGDLVITHTGRSRRVLGTQSKMTSEQMRSIKVKGWCFPLKCTDNHLLPVWDGSGINWTKAKDVKADDMLLIGYGTAEPKDCTIDVLDFIEAADIDSLVEYKYAPHKNKKADVSTTHRRTSAMVTEARSRGLIGKQLLQSKGGRLENAIPRFINVGKSFARLVGLYLAEGSCDDHRVCFTLSVDESHLGQEILDLAKSVFGIEGIAKVHPSRPNTLHVRVPGKSLVQFFKAFCPGNARTKRVPSVFFGCHPEVQKALLSGWIDGDGYVRKREGGTGHGRICVVSSSRKLICDMASLSGSCGVPFVVTYRKARGISKESFSLDMRPGFAVKENVGGVKMQAAVSFKAETRSAALTRFGIAKRVVTNEAIGIPEDAVWDIEVDVDQTFIADCFVVHNCVGAGGLTAMVDTAIGDILARGDIEDPVIPFHLATYGVGRQLSGMRSKGDGSFGGGQAKAMAEFGFLYHDDISGLPKPSVSNGWMWYSKAIEYAWSHPSAWPSGMSLEAMREKAKPFGVGEFKRMRSAKDVKEARAARMGVTMACNFGTRGCKVVDGVLLAEWDGSWAHQQSVGGYDEHESLGDIFEINNQWKDAHGHCPLLFGKYGAFGSYWIRSATMDRICEKGEVYAYINTGGRKLTEVNWKNLGITYGTAA